jgi:hypothetical protein
MFNSCLWTAAVPFLRPSSLGLFCLHHSPISSFSTRNPLFTPLIQAKHSMALELLGERNERIEQLEEDVAEMKRIFREQLSVAADQLLEARTELAMVKADCVGNRAGHHV